MNKIYRFYNELKRRNVIKAGISYLVVSWVVLQVVALIGDILKAPEWLGRTLLIVLLCLLPLWLLFSWYYEITPDGIRKTQSISPEKSISEKTSYQLNLIIIAFLSIAVILLFVDRYRIQHSQEVFESSLIQELVQENSIVVLPFRDLSPQKDQEYFADGLAEELLSALTKISQLKVTSRTSAFSFKGKALDIPTIAQKLNVNYILEGSIRKADSLVRITIQLIDANADKSLWSENWDHELGNIFNIQDAITNAVVNTLEISLSDLIIPESTKTDPKAYALSLEAKYWLEKSYDNQAYLEKALNLTKQSIAIDDKYAPSWVIQSNSYRLLASAGHLEKDFGYEQAINAARKSIALDSNNPRGYSSLANALLEYRWDVKEATLLLEKALELEPNNSSIIDNLAGIELINGNLNRSIQLNEKSYRLDPINPYVIYNLGLAYYYNTDYEKAIIFINKSLEIIPDQPGVHGFLAIMHGLLENHQQAQIEQSKENNTEYKLFSEGLIYWFSGNQLKADKALELLVDQHGEFMQNEIAQIYAVRNELDLSFAWLEKAYDNKNFMLLEMQNEPLFRNLHEDPRWDTFLRKMNLK
jgi:TolB-like protein/Flp pilus assembly protein TadD